jgi:hypothetical protein
MAKEQLDILRSVNSDKASPFIGVGGAMLRADSLSSYVAATSAELTRQHPSRRSRK